MHQDGSSSSLKKKNDKLVSWKSPSQQVRIRKLTLASILIADPKATLAERRFIRSQPSSDVKRSMKAALIPTFSGSWSRSANSSSPLSAGIGSEVAASVGGIEVLAG
ncbi:hypothetical protein PanWU01x14_208150 [Parasponia andersonii]|uniref:Uncharacterized protein n=1 Tax=Parasponia andersonii TaxID=3476 RepID=A0A2P5BUV5_PARAD|nr:hypothetical protein PanWU01x14_208150 [Parasponia andersonii]